MEDASLGNFIRNFMSATIMKIYMPNNSFKNRGREREREEDKYVYLQMYQTDGFLILVAYFQSLHGRVAPELDLQLPHDLITSVQFGLELLRPPLHWVAVKELNIPFHNMEI